MRRAAINNPSRVRGSVKNRGCRNLLQHEYYRLLLVAREGLQMTSAQLASLKTAIGGAALSFLALEHCPTDCGSLNGLSLSLSLNGLSRASSLGCVANFIRKDIWAKWLKIDDTRREKSLIDDIWSRRVLTYVGSKHFY